jgi:hypothetical protein
MTRLWLLRETASRELARCLSTTKAELISRQKSLPTKAQPASLASTSSAVYVATSSGLEIHPSSGSSSVHPGSTLAVAAHAGSDGDLIAFGSGAKGVTLATVTGGSVKVEESFEDNKGEVLAVAFSPQGNLVAAGDVSCFTIYCLIDVAEITVAWANYPD